MVLCFIFFSHAFLRDDPPNGCRWPNPFVGLENQNRAGMIAAAGPTYL
jgi:hypothetical protein